MVAVTTNANAPHIATIITMRCIGRLPLGEHSANPCGRELALGRRRSVEVKSWPIRPGTSMRPCGDHRAGTWDAPFDFFRDEEKTTEEE